MTWQEFWNQYINLSPGIGQIALRLLCAMAVGALVGIEREYTHRPAGMRTHILVALGACVASVMGEMIFAQYGGTDPARLSAQVITGVGFLGAGTIMKEGVNVKGLTTAAGVWSVACLGIAAGFGYYTLALLGTVFALITLTIFESIQRKLVHSRSAEIRYVLETCDVAAALEAINQAAQGGEITVFDMEVNRRENGAEIRFHAWFTGRHVLERRREFFTALASDDCIGSVYCPGQTAETKVETR